MIALRGFREHNGGQSLVEFAIVVPVLVLLLIGIVDIALSINAYTTVTNASREAAIYAAASPAAPLASVASVAAARIYPLPTTSPLVCAATPAPSAPRGICVSVSYIPNGGATFVPWPAAGLASSSPSSSQVPIKVDVCYPWAAATILIGQFFHGGTACSTGQSGDAFFHGTSTVVITW